MDVAGDWIDENAQGKDESYEGYHKRYTNDVPFAMCRNDFYSLVGINANFSWR